MFLPAMPLLMFLLVTVSACLLLFLHVQSAAACGVRGINRTNM
jgi:hypothetical protein